MGADHSQPVACIMFFALTLLIYLDGTEKLPLVFCCCFESLQDCVVRVGGHILDPRRPEPLVGCRSRACVHRRRAGDRLWRRLDHAARNRPAHRNPLRLDWIRAALGQSPASQSRFDAQTHVQYGLTDSLTAFGETAFEQYAIGEPTPNTYNGLDYSGLGLRQKLWSTGEWVFSGEATAFIPGAHDSRAPAQEGNTGWAGEARLNAGRNFTFRGVPGFLDAEVAFRVRTKGPPDEWHGDVTVGFKFTPQIMLMLQDFTTVSMSTDNR